MQNLTKLLGVFLEGSASEVFPADRMLYMPVCNQVYYPDLIILPEETKLWSIKEKWKTISTRQL